MALCTSSNNASCPFCPYCLKVQLQQIIFSSNIPSEADKFSTFKRLRVRDLDSVCPAL